jgi:NADH:ubiquinone oxidoreductase subunit 5 (subunit L)/multisubunit Na+/H+ antiporter MnhA subunit
MVIIALAIILLVSLIGFLILAFSMKHMRDDQIALYEAIITIMVALNILPAHGHGIRTVTI